LHITAAIITEVKEGGAIISAMFTGRKIFDQPPLDDNKTGDEQH
jgi:cytochrome b